MAAATRNHSSPPDHVDLERFEKSKNPSDVLCSIARQFPYYERRLSVADAADVEDIWLLLLLRRCRLHQDGERRQQSDLRVCMPHRLFLGLTCGRPRGRPLYQVTA